MRSARSAKERDAARKAAPPMVRGGTLKLLTTGGSSGKLRDEAGGKDSPRIDPSQTQMYSTKL